MYNFDANLLLASLSGLRCPFEDDTRVVLCAFYSHNGYCPFIHKTDSPSSLYHQAHKVPPLICHNYLMGQCKKWLYKFSSVNSTSEMGLCLDGFHPSWMHWVKTDTLNRAMQALKYELIKARQQTQLPDYQCAICLETIESRSITFALLLDCPHIFCGGCIFGLTESGHYNCPLCRTEIIDLIFWITAERVDRETMLVFEKKLEQTIEGLLNIEETNATEWAQSPE